MLKSCIPHRVLAIFGAILLASATSLSGCKTGPSLSASVLPYAERTSLADQAISEAIAAFGKGDQAKGDAYLHRAVILLTGSLSGDFNDEGFIEVAQRIAALGRPNDAMRLLEPLTQDSRVNADPRLWAALADAAMKAADTHRAEEASESAQKAAAKIESSFGEPTPASKEATRYAELATYVGQYYSDFSRKDFAGALRAYREAHRLMPGAIAVRNNLGYMLAEHGTTEEDIALAVRLTRSVVEEQPDHPIFLDSLGWALYKRGDQRLRDKEAARLLLREAVDLAPAIPECRYHLAVVYGDLGLVSDALREANRAVQIRPQYEEAKALVKELTARIAAQPTSSPTAREDE